MTIKIRLPNNVVIEADNQYDLRAVFAALGISNGVSQTVQGEPPKEQSALDRLQKLWGRLGSENQRQALRALAEASDGLSDSELRSLLQFKSNNELAGVIGGIAKNAKAVGLKIDHVLIKQVLADGYAYRLTPEARDIAVEQSWARKPLL